MFVESAGDRPMVPNYLVVMTDGRVDSIDDLSIHTKSDSWIKQIGGVYNKITN